MEPTHSQTADKKWLIYRIQQDWDTNDGWCEVKRPYTEKEQFH